MKIPKIAKFTLLGVSALLLMNCTSNGFMTIDTSDAPQSAIKGVTQSFVGIPMLLGLEGSKVRLNSTWHITAKHNEGLFSLQRADMYKHPTCDIMLVKDVDNKAATVNYTTKGTVSTGDEIINVGYPLLPPLIVANKGEYTLDIKLDGCQYSLSNAATRDGMSGGGVFTPDGVLVGVVVGVYNGSEDFDRQSVWLSLSNPSVSEWLVKTMKDNK